MTANYKYTMNPAEGPNLTSLRCLLFFFFGGIGCLMPFLSLHSRSIGFTITEIRWLSIIVPIVAFFGPLIAGPLVDHFYRRKKRSDIKFETNSCIRFTLSSTILLSVIFYSLLLAVPPTDRQKPKEPKITFACNYKSGWLLQEGCHNGLGCYQYKTEKHVLIKLMNCTYDCSSFDFHRFDDNNDDDDKSLEIDVATKPSIEPTTENDWVIGEPQEPPPFNGVPDLNVFFGNDGNETIDDEDDDEENGSGEIESRFLRSEPTTSYQPPPPHICVGKKRMCNVYTPHSRSLDIEVTIQKSFEDKGYCFYPLSDKFECANSPDLQNKCKVICDLRDPYATNSALQQTQCFQEKGDKVVSFWLYLTFRALGDFFTSISISLLIGAILSALRNRIGFEFVTPSVAYALFATLAGCLQTQGFGLFQMGHVPPFVFSIIGFGLLSLISIFILIFSSQMTIGPPDWWTTSKTETMRHKGEFFGLLLVLTLLGMLWGPYYFHVPLHILTSDAEIYIGSSVGIGALLSVIIVWKADFLVNYCGYSNLLIVAFTIYIIRYTGLLFINIPYILILTNSFELFTMTLMFFSAILYIRYLVPKHLTFTAQSLGFAAHFCLGNGLGCVISSLLSPTEDVLQNLSENNRTKITSNEATAYDNPHHLFYCFWAIFAAVCAAVYFILYHFCLKKQCLAPIYTRTTPNETPLVQGTNNGNGIYTPLVPVANGNQNPPTDDL